MTERFLKFIPSKEAMFLLKNKGHAFRLLSIIAESARRYEGEPDGLKAGECFIGGHQNYDMTEQNYRTAKEILIKRQHIKIVETSRTRKKSTNGVTTAGTKVKLLSSDVWDINFHMGNERGNECPTNAQRMPNDKQERRRRKKKNEKESHPSIPSDRDEVDDDDDLSSKEKEKGKEEKEATEIVPGVFLTEQELEACVKIKGNVERVIEAINFIQSSKKRKHPISDWPNALSRWKIENKPRFNVENNIGFAEKLCKEYETFKQGRGWRCYMYTDRNKDQRGILFEPESVYQQGIFVSLVDGEFKEKCDKLLINNKMPK